MSSFEEFLTKIEDEKNRFKLKSILDYIEKKFPNLEQVIKWNQPMFTDHQTFIIGFSVSKNHISVAPESKTINMFRDEIVNSGYTLSKEIFRIKWDQKINYGLLENIVKFNVMDKKEYKKFWR